MTRSLACSPILVALIAAQLPAQQFATVPTPGLFPPQDELRFGGPPDFFDFDGDGDLDVFRDGRFFENVADGIREFVEVLPRLDLPAVGVSLVLDFDADGDLDVLCGVDDRPDGLRWLENDGSGRFVARLFAPGVVAVSDLQAGDVDADGDLDLFVARGFSVTGPLESDLLFVQASPGIYVDESASRFSQSADVTSDLDVFDADGDGDLDLARSFRGVNFPDLWLNDGAGIFTRSFGRLPFLTAWTMTPADLDEDGDVDLVATSRDAPHEHVFVNDGAGSFVDGTVGRLPPRLAFDLFLAQMGVGQFEHEVLDVDGDGNADIVGNPILARPMVRLGDGTGAFLVEDGTVPAGRRSALVDFDRDGDVDVVSERLVVSVRLADGSFADTVIRTPTYELGYGPLAARLPRTREVARMFGEVAVDFDDDGDLDVVRPGYFPSVPGAYSIGTFVNDGTPSGVFLGPFVTTGQTTSPSEFLGGVAVAPFDADGDGDLDIALASAFVGSGSWEPRLMLADGAGGFIEADALAFPRDRIDCDDLAAVDFEQDGDLDLLLATTAGLRLYENDGAGRFTVVPGLVSPERALDLDVVDLDGDGFEDVVMSSAVLNLAEIPTPTPTRWLRSLGPAGLADAGALLLPTRRVRGADLDGDGDGDLVVVTPDGRLRWFRNDGFRNDGAAVFVEPSEQLPQQEIQQPNVFPRFALSRRRLRRRRRLRARRRRGRGQLGTASDAARSTALGACVPRARRRRAGRPGRDRNDRAAAGRIPRRTRRDAVRCARPGSGDRGGAASRARPRAAGRARVRRVGPERPDAERP